MGKVSRKGTHSLLGPILQLCSVIDQSSRMLTVRCGKPQRRVKKCLKWHCKTGQSDRSELTRNCHIRWGRVSGNGKNQPSIPIRLFTGLTGESAGKRRMNSTPGKNPSRNINFPCTRVRNKNEVAKGMRELSVQFCLIKYLLIFLLKNRCSVTAVLTSNDCKIA